MAEMLGARPNWWLHRSRRSVCSAARLDILTYIEMKKRLAFLLAFFAAGVASPSVLCSQRWIDQPQIVNFETPDYPQMAKAACIQGNVAILVEIAADGTVTHCDVLYGHLLLAPIAEKAARATKFSAVKGGTIERQEVLKYHFRIVPAGRQPRMMQSIRISATEVEVRSLPSEMVTTCDDGPKREQKRQKRPGCGPYRPNKRTFEVPRPN